MATQSEAWKAAVKNAERLAEIRDQKQRDYGSALSIYLEKLKELRNSTEQLESVHGKDWWRHSDSPERTKLRQEIYDAGRKSDSAHIASIRAQKKWERASNFQVIRTFTDATGWVANPNYGIIPAA